MPPNTAIRFRPARRLEGDVFTNGQRAGFADKAVAAFLAATGEPVVTDADSVRDVIADLLHLCDREGIDAETVLVDATHDWKLER